MFLLLPFNFEYLLRPRILTPKSFVIRTGAPHFFLQFLKHFLLSQCPIFLCSRLITPSQPPPIKTLDPFLPPPLYLSPAPQLPLRPHLTLFHTSVAIHLCREDFFLRPSPTL